MASQKEKFEQDAERAGKRSFPGYLADRALGRADFAKAEPVTTVRAEPVAPLGSESVLKRRERAAGLKKGGAVRGDGVAQRGRTRGKMR